MKTIQGLASTNFFLLLIGILSATVLLACQKDKGVDNPSPVDSNAFTVAVNPSNKFQTIAGFGGANRMWGTEFLQPTEAALAFSTEDDGLGLSIFRVRIASDPAEWPRILESVQEAQKFGIKIQASPWSPPANMKSNNNLIGGYLLPEHYEDFKDHLNAFVRFMADNGVDIYAISIQNEPDIQVSYESCDWTAGNMANFIRTYGSQIEGTRVAAPESFNFNQSFTNALLSDNETAAHLDIVAGHIYGGGLAPFPMAEAQDKEIWMTEYLMNLNTGNAGASPWTSYSEETIWEESLDMLRTIHESMTLNWNAYIWWYIQRYYSFIGDGEQGTEEGAILKRGQAFAHYSRYIRPGFIRVEADTNAASELLITAYEGADQIVIVVVNPEDTAIGNVNFKVPSVSSAQVITTSEILNRAERPSSIIEDRVVVGILGKSVTTVIIDK